jgi:hypothetical protein
MRWARHSVAVLLLSGCGSARTAPTPILTPGVIEEPITAVLVAALDADSRLQPADGLWDPNATVVANGELRYAPPRFAGVEPGGEVAITSSRLEVRQSLIWVFLEYRWLSVKEGVARAGRATVLLTPRAEGAGWKIIHLHSSTPDNRE